MRYVLGYLFALALVGLLLLGFCGTARAESPGAASLPEIGLEAALVWVFAGGGAGALAWRIVRKGARFRLLSPRDKRLCVAGISSGLAVGAWALLTAGLVSVGRPDVSWPVGWWAWAQQLFLLAGTSFGLATMIHGEQQLSRKVPDEDDDAEADDVPF